MKRIVFFLLLVLLAPLVLGNCSDSDNGIIYGRIGTTYGTNDAVNGGYIERTDYCDGKTLYEYYCANLSEAGTPYDSVVAKIEFTCSYDCANGACINEPEKTDTTKKTSSSSGGGGGSSSSSENELVNIPTTNNEIQSSGNVINLGSSTENSKSAESKNSFSLFDNSVLVFLLISSLFCVVLILVLVVIIKKKRAKKLTKRK